MLFSNNQESRIRAWNKSALLWCLLTRIHIKNFKSECHAWKQTSFSAIFVGKAKNSINDADVVLIPLPQWNTLGQPTAIQQPSLPKNQSIFCFYFHWHHSDQSATGSGSHSYTQKQTVIFAEMIAFCFYSSVFCFLLLFSQTSCVWQRRNWSQSHAVWLQSASSLLWPSISFHQR